MNNTLKSFFIIILIFFTSIYSVNIITDYFFNNQPFHFIGEAPFDIDNIEKVNEKPANTKALLSYENGSLNIFLPKDAQYIQQIMPEINIINYKISKLQNELISNYITVDENINQSKIFEISKTAKEILIISFIFLSGIFSKAFTKKSYFLLSFNYVKQFLNKIIFFSIMIISIILISNFLTDYIFIERLFFFSVSSVILANTFVLKWIKILIYILTLYFYFLPPIVINYNYLFFTAILINFFIAYISTKKINIIKTENIEEEKSNDR
ncbi:MAG: hypothetical protein ACQESN_06110 [Thermotogota bacterium]